MENKFKTGEKVIVNGYEGRIFRYYSEGMVEVRLESGLVCVPEHEIKKENI